MSTDSSLTEERDILSVDENDKNPPDSNGEEIASHVNEESENIGDEIMYKDEDVIRIGLINIRGIPESNEAAKNEHTKSMINVTRFDHVGLTEINKQWNYIQHDHRWHSRIKHWWQHSKSVISYNNKDINNDVFQPGGTISLAKESL